MEASASFASFSTKNHSRATLRILFLAALVVLTLISILLKPYSGFAQTATVSTTTGPIASVPSPGQVQDMKLLAPGVGWALQQNHLYWTRDNGQNWSDITPQDSNQEKIKSAFFLQNGSGWAVLSGLVESNTSATVVATIDSGQNWVVVNENILNQPGVPVNGIPSAIFFVDQSYGWLVLRQVSSSNFSFGDLLMTQDGGISWKALPSPPSFGDIFLQSMTNGWFLKAPNSDKLWVTRDGGQQWIEVQVPMPDNCAYCIVRYSLPHFVGGQDTSSQSRSLAAEHQNLLSTLAMMPATHGWQSTPLEIPGWRRTDRQQLMWTHTPSASILQKKGASAHNPWRTPTSRQFRIPFGQWALSIRFNLWMTEMDGQSTLREDVST